MRARDTLIKNAAPADKTRASLLARVIAPVHSISLVTAIHKLLGQFQLIIASINQYVCHAKPRDVLSSEPRLPARRYRCANNYRMQPSDKFTKSTPFPCREACLGVVFDEKGQRARICALPDKTRRSFHRIDFELRGC